ncbi:MAG: hypothetical protein QHI48_06275 [Bacteroidota bacterium]|nr:hypothetical protein [Bacteroidota bacterium]
MRNSVFYLVAPVFFLLILVLPLSVPQRVHVPGIVLPAREWHAVRPVGGPLEVILYDHVAGSTESILIHQFERQDAIRVELSRHVTEGGWVQAGDTLVTVHSADLALLQAEMEGSLDAASAALDVQRTGEKASLVEEARGNLARARAEYEGLERTRARARLMFERGLIAQQELDEADRSADAARAALTAAEAHFRAVSTGAKEEQIQYSKSQIAALQRRREALERKRSFFSLRAPFPGRIYKTVFSDTIVRLGDPSRFVAVMSVPLEKAGAVAVGDSVSTTVAMQDLVLSGRVVLKSDIVQTRTGRQYVTVAAVLDTEGTDIPPGIRADCEISHGRVSLRRWLFDRIAGIFRAR